MKLSVFRPSRFDAIWSHVDGYHYDKKQQIKELYEAVKEYFREEIDNASSEQMTHFIQEMGQLIATTLNGGITVNGTRVNKMQALQSNMMKTALFALDPEFLGDNTIAQAVRNFKDEQISRLPNAEENTYLYRTAEYKNANKYLKLASSIIDQHLMDNLTIQLASESISVSDEAQIQALLKANFDQLIPASPTSIALR
jgi:hypothetical protein